MNESNSSISDDELFPAQRSARDDDDSVNMANENEEEDFVRENNALPGILPALPEEIAPDLAELGASAAAGNNSTTERGGKLDAIVAVGNNSTAEGGEAWLSWTLLPKSAPSRDHHHRPDPQLPRSVQRLPQLPTLVLPSRGQEVS